MSEAEIERVVAVFTDRGVAWALVGAHAIGLLTTPRATADFDFIVDGRKLAEVLLALTEEFGDLGQNDIGAAIQLKAIDVDLIRSTNHPLFHEALQQPRRVGSWSVPQTEVLIVLKFLAAVSPWRALNRRRQDVIDIVSIFEAVTDLDQAKLMALSALVYPGAEVEFRSLLDKIEQGSPISI